MDIILLSLKIKENTILNFLLYTHYRNTYMGANSYKLKLLKIGNRTNWIGSSYLSNLPMLSMNGYM